MKVQKLYDYTSISGAENGLTLAILVSEPENAEIEEKDFIPKSIENRKSSAKRIATFISVYKEEAYLYIEEKGADIKYIKDVLDNLEGADLDPYEFQKIVYRSPNKVKIEKISEGYRLNDRKSNMYFSTHSSSNPQKAD